VYIDLLFDFTLNASCSSSLHSFSSNHTPPTEIYTLSLHDALPISSHNSKNSPHRKNIVKMSNYIISIMKPHIQGRIRKNNTSQRSEEHTSELQSRFDLVCRLLLEKKKR